jgi:hypothetical protein
MGNIYPFNKPVMHQASSTLHQQLNQHKKKQMSQVEWINVFYAILNCGYSKIQSCDNERLFFNCQKEKAYDIQ